MTDESIDSIDKINCVLKARKFLQNLIDKKLTPRVPRTVREEAENLLKEFPDGFDAIFMERGLQQKDERKTS